MEQERKKQVRWTSRVGFWLAAFLVLYGVWVLFTSNPNWQELAIGVAAAAIGATAFEATREQPVAQFRPKLRWIGEAWRLPGYVFAGAYEIFKVMTLQLLRIKPGESLIRGAEFDAGGDDPASAARRALAITYTTVPPNFIVVGIDLAADLLVFHQISPERVPQMTVNLGAK